MLGTGPTGRNLYETGTRPIYQLEPKLGFRPRPVYELEPKTGKSDTHLQP